MKDSKIRVYIINLLNTDKNGSELNDMSDIEFMDEAILNGKVYSLGGFQDSFNASFIDVEDSYMRIL